MSDIYKIGVAIMLTQNGVAPALSAISHQLIGIHRSVGQINSGFGQWRTALVGAAGVMAGSALLTGLAKVASYGEKFLDQQAKLRLLGLNNKQIAEATAKAWANTRAVPGTDVAENLKGIGELVGPAGFEHAIAASKKLTELDRVLQQVTGKAGSAYTATKAAELLGQFSEGGEFDPNRFGKFVDMMERSVIATHGKVTPADWLNFAKQAGPSAGNLDENGFLTTMAVMQAMGGHRGGTAMAALFRQFGGGVMSQRVAKELERIGVAQPNDFDIGKGGQVIAKTGAMKDMVGALSSDPLSAVTNILLPKLRAAGFDTNEKLATELYRIIGTGPAQRLIYELARNPGQIAGERERAKVVLGSKEANETLTGQSPIGAKTAVAAAFHNMMVALGSEALRAAIPVMTELTKLFNKIGQFAIAHPTAVKIIGEGLAVIGVALIAAGGVAILAAFGPAGWIAAGLVVLGAGIAAFMTYWDKFVAKFKEISAWIFGSGETTDKRTMPPSMFQGGRPNVVPPAPAAAKGDHVGAVYMDGQKVGSIVTGHQVASASSALQGSAYFDPTQSMMPVDYSFGRA
jgi:hypothetical protein